MVKFTFKREPRTTGLAGIGYPNQSVEIKLKKQIVGTIGAPNWMSKDNKWVVRFMVKLDGGCGWKWITLKMRFDSEDEARTYINQHVDKIVALNLHERGEENP